MNLSADFTGAGETYLDPAQPLRINGEIVDIQTMVDSPQKLRVVKFDNIDVTKYVKFGTGEKNEIVVNYVPKGTNKSRIPGWKAGTLTLSVVVRMADAKEKIVEKIVEKATIGPTKFCMNCQFSMAVDANFCPKCGLSPESFSGQDTKTCVNCKETIPARAKYCAKCGAEQPLTS